MVPTGLWWIGSAMCSAALPSTLLHSEPLHRLHSANQLPSEIGATVLRACVPAFFVATNSRRIVDWSM